MPNGQTRRTRNDPRGDATRITLIEAAERLFGERGVDGVSTREIGAAVGSNNTNVVAYYFGNKEQLVEAILRHRLPGLEARRAELLRAAEVLRAADDPGGVADAATLLRVLWYPLFELTNGAGQHSYAAFLATLARTTWGRARSAMNDDYPTTREITARLRHALASLDDAHFAQRRAVCLAMITESLGHIDREDRKQTIAPETLFEDALRMAISAMTSPVP